MTKKLTTAVFYVSLPLILVGTVLVFFTPEILELLPEFLETKVFHRTFDHEAWRDSMLSLIVFPVFFVILMDALCFTGFSDRKKNVTVIFYLLSVISMLTVLSGTCAKSFVGQDLSSELLFAQECFQNRTFWPTGWYYSMEFRFLNTQLVTAPLFFFTRNLSLLRALTVLLTDVLLFTGCWFLLHELRIRTLWIKLLCCTLIVSPASWTFLNVVQGGSYYIPHIVFSFFYVGLFISIIFNEHSRSKEGRLRLVFLVLAFLSGVSTIRYILNFTFPVFAVAVLGKMQGMKKNAAADAPCDGVFAKSLFADKGVRTASLALLLSCLGYVFNSTLLASMYTFKNMNNIQFNPLVEMQFDEIKNMFLEVVGYNERISVFTPGGIANILLTVVLALTVIVMRDLWKGEEWGLRKFFLGFVIFFSAFHLYTNIFTEMACRYFTMVLVFFIPVLALTLESNAVTSMKKWILAVSAAVFMLTNTYLSFCRMLTNDESLELGGVCDFLVDKGYEFGYAFSGIANPIWFWSDGAVEVVAVDDEEIDGVDTLPESFAVHKWLEPKKYEDEDYYKGEKPVFFVMRQKEYEQSEASSVLEHGRPVYEDSLYIVLEYDSPEAFVRSF